MATYGSGKMYYPGKSFETSKGALPQVSGVPKVGLVQGMLGIFGA